MNLLFLSVSPRGEMLRHFKEQLGEDGKIVVTGNDPTEGLLYFSDKQYIVPTIDDENYIDTILEICKQEEINVATTMFDDEVGLLAKNRKKFEDLGICLLGPSEDTASLCYDKFKMYNFLKNAGINTTPTYGDLESFKEALQEKKIQFPVFVKPRSGCGSEGAQKVGDMKELEELFRNDPSLIVQELMKGKDIDADVYVDAISKKAVAAFTKLKLQTQLGGTAKAISFKDEKLFDFIQKVIDVFDFTGTVDMDLFEKEGKYYLSEINPRFGGAHLHAYLSGANFIPLMVNNGKGIENKPQIGNYEEDCLMMVYESVVVKKKGELAHFFQNNKLI